MPSFTTATSKAEIEVIKVDETNCKIVYWEITSNGKKTYRDEQTMLFSAMATDVQTKLTALGLT